MQLFGEHIENQFFAFCITILRPKHQRKIIFFILLS